MTVLLVIASSPVWAQQASPVSLQSPPTEAKTATPPPVSPAPKPPVGEYTVSPEDLLDINVLDVPEVTRTYRVNSNGFLTLPLLTEPIPAAGATLDQLAHLIATKFHDAGMLSNAQVTVSLRETRLHTVLISGEVKRPESYPVYGPTHLLDVLVQCGGLTETAGDDAIIMRGDIGAAADAAESTQTGKVNLSVNRTPFSLNIRQLVQTGTDDDANVLLYPGDRVTVQRASLVYVMGAVFHPGGYVLNETRQNITVLKALAMAGDVTNVAKKNHITLLRRDPTSTDDKRQEIPVNYRAMVKGVIADIHLKPDDILYVPESGALKAWRTAVSSAVAVGTGFAIYR